MTGPGDVRSPCPGGTASPAVRVAIVGRPGPSRTHLRDALDADHDIVVAGETVATEDVMALVERVRPEVIILELTGEGGAAGRKYTEAIMSQRPTPILALLEPSPAGGAGATGAAGAAGAAGGAGAAGAAGTIGAAGAAGESEEATEIIMAGALRAVASPTQWTAAEGADLCRQVRALRGVTVIRHPRGRSGGPEAVAGPRSSRLVAIAASTGGPAALATLLAGLRGVSAPVLVIQHIHPDFVDGLVTWMARIAPVPVRRAVHGADLQPGVVYFGPGDVHLKVGPGPSALLDPEPETRHRPSADELFLSVAAQAGAGAIGVVLTGMGNDGTAGLLAIKGRGGLTIAQDEATSAVFGMPRAAQIAGAVTLVLPLEDIAAAVVAASRGSRL